MYALILGVTKLAKSLRSKQQIESKKAEGSVGCVTSPPKACNFDDVGGVPPHPDRESTQPGKKDEL